MKTIFFLRFCLSTMVLLLAILPTVLAQSPDTLWTRTFGSSEGDYGNAVQQTPDGGFIVAGQVRFNGQLTSGDLWLIRTNSDGDTLWTKTYGGPGIDMATAVLNMPDNGYAISGYTTSADGFDRDAWLLRTDALGDTLWTKTYGGSSSDDARSMQATSDGGFVLAGGSRSFGPGALDAWLIRTDANGDTLWTKTFGNSGSDFANAVYQTSDGGFILCGRLFSLSIGAPDLWLIRTDANGDTLWTKTYNGPHYPWSFDQGNDVKQTADGGFIVAGSTNGLPSTTNSNVWLIRTDAIGDTLWTNELGGTGIEKPTSLEQSSDGSFVISATGFTIGNDLDALLLGVGSSGDSLWEITMGGSSTDQVKSVKQTSDGGWIVSGYTSSFGQGDVDIWMLRFEEIPTLIGEPADTPALQDFQLFQNFPNPFNPDTVVEFEVRNSEPVKLVIYDLLGRRVRQLFEGKGPTGPKRVVWDGTDANGAAVASGTYLYRLEAASQLQTRKMMLIK